MTIAQYMKLNIGDTVARTNGPNKGIPLVVLTKYMALNTYPCLSAMAKDPNIKLYRQNKNGSATHYESKSICGACSTFKILKGEKDEKDYL